MYLHIGQDTVVRTDTIVGVFDLETSTISKKTRDFLSKAEKEGNVITVSYELPRSFIICNENGSNKIYISSISSHTLIKRKGRL